MISLFFFIGYANTGICGVSMQRTDSEHFNNMEELAFWFIETGLGQYYERKGKNDYKLRPRDPEWFVRHPDDIWISDYVEEQGYWGSLPQVERLRKIARIIFEFDNGRSKNITECYLRAEYKGEIYEYWVIKEYTLRSNYRQAKFIIVKAVALNSERVVIHSCSQFVEKYKIDEEFSVVFPIEDMKILKDLGAWAYRDNFKYSNLKDFAVLEPEMGKYVKKPMSPKRFWEFWK